MDSLIFHLHKKLEIRNSVQKVPAACRSFNSMIK